MRRLRLVPDQTHFRFMRWRKFAFSFTLLLTLVSVGAILGLGFNLGVDYAGGVLIEARALDSVDLAALRGRLNGLGLGEVTLQTVGTDRDLLIRVQAQHGGGAVQNRAVAAVKAQLQPGFEIRRTESIGPQISAELLRGGLLAALLAVLLIGVYVWFRFEWQFGVAAVLTTFHDIIATFGLFALLQLEFNQTVLAALLTIAGYSINDTVVVFDRVRENLRLYKSLPMTELIDRSVNQTLGRTLMTSGTTLLAVLALLLFGGPVLRNFSLALIWGLVVGTYSSVFVASALLLHLPSPRPAEPATAPQPEAGRAAPDTPTAVKSGRIHDLP